MAASRRRSNAIFGVLPCWGPRRPLSARSLGAPIEAAMVRSTAPRAPSHALTASRRQPQAAPRRRREGMFFWLMDDGTSANWRSCALEDGISRTEFLRRSGALGIAGAASLGYSLLEARAEAAPLGPVREVIAAGGSATVKI